jgi:superfamily I DNA/RNA helicase
MAAVYAAYDERLQTCGARDYDDLLLDLLELLRVGTHPPVAIRHLLVDEFQDVNAVQYELVRNLAGDGRGLFVIGDPDQAIYGFRGADPRFFDRLRHDCPATSVHRLRRNYRSADHVVAASAAVIGAGLSSTAVVDPATRRKDGPTIRIVDAASELAEGISVVRVVQEMVGGTDMVATDQTSGVSAPGEYSFGDVAVLFRTGRQAAVLEECFATEGLPYRVAGPKRFLEERGARDAVAFFRYALESERPLRMLEALRTGPFDVGAESLACLSAAIGSGDALQAAVDALPTGAAAQAEALRRAAEGYARRAQSERPESVLRIWQQDLEVEATTAFEQLLRVADTADSMEELLDTLLLGREGDVARHGGQTTAAEAVTLMTMHAAKGLEFPVVIVCGVEDGLLPLRAADGTADVEEERRLLYVAMTRARDRLILTRAGSRVLRGQRQSLPPSPFLDDLPAALWARETAAQPRRRGHQLSLF